MDDDGTGSSWDVELGIAYVVSEFMRTGRPSIINMSLGTEADDAVDAAVERAIRAGIYVVAAAGNEDRDACVCSPARGKNVITVGAITTNDERAEFSNFGDCVDVFAPGTNIKSTFIDHSYLTLDGTSM